MRIFQFYLNETVLLERERQANAHSVIQATIPMKHCVSFSATDLNNGEVKWKVTLSEYPELAARGIPRQERKTTAVRS